jgi:hypothetical protein
MLTHQRDYKNMAAADIAYALLVHPSNTKRCSRIYWEHKSRPRMDSRMLRQLEAYVVKLRRRSVYFGQATKSHKYPAVPFDTAVCEI